MSATITLKVENKKFNQFMEVFRAHGCRFVSNPIRFNHSVLVDFEVADYSAFYADWDRLNANIVETRSDTWCNRIIRRVSLLFK